MGHATVDGQSIYLRNGNNKLRDCYCDYSWGPRTSTKKGSQNKTLKELVKHGITNCYLGISRNSTALVKMHKHATTNKNCVGIP